MAIKARLCPLGERLTPLATTRAAGAKERLMHVESPSTICQHQGKRSLPVHVKDFGLDVHGWHRDCFLTALVGLAEFTCNRVSLLGSQLDRRCGAGSDQ